MKYINLSKYLQELYAENYIILMKEIKEDLSGDIYYVQPSDDSTSLTC